MSWICAQGPQIYTNYLKKSTEGISGHFLLLWFLGDFLSFTSCLLSDTVLEFQVYISFFFLTNDMILTGQYLYYNRFRKGLKGRLELLESENDQGGEVEQYKDVGPIDIANESIISRKHRPEVDKKRETIRICDSFSSKSPSPGTYNSLGETKKGFKAFIAATAFASADAAIMSKGGHINLATNEYILSRATLSLILAWACTVIYCSSRLPQLWKNFQRKSVDGISPVLFGAALVANVTYTLSILVSCDFIYSDSKSSFIANELPYILGSSGTIMFDLAYFYQRALYRRMPTVMIDMQNWQEI